MSIYEYDEEAHMQMLQEDSYEEGQKAGAAKTLVNLVTSAMQKLKGTEADACDFLEIPEADYCAAKKLLEEQQSAAALRSQAEAI